MTTTSTRFWSLVVVITCCCSRGDLRGQTSKDNIRPVIELADQLEWTWTWGEWVGNAAIALDAKKPVPVPPLGFDGKDKILAIIQKEFDAAGRIEVPQATAPLPAVAKIQTTDHDSMRAAMQQAMAPSTQAVIELEEIEAFQRAASDLAIQIKRQFSVLGQVQEVLLHVAERIPQPDIEKQLVFAFVDIEILFEPELQKVEDLIVAKAAAARSTVTARASLLLKRAYEVRLLALGEEAALSAEAQRLAKNAAALLARRQALDRMRNQLDAEESAIERLRDETEANRAEIQRIDRDLVTWQGWIAEAVRDREDYVKERRKSYNRCPGTPPQPYASCDHKSLREQWDNESRSSEYVQQRNQLIQTYSRLGQEGRDRQQALRQNNVQLTKEADERQAVWSTQNSKWSKEAATWSTDFQVDLEDRWRSRANLHWQANQSDLAQLRETITRLAALGGKP